MKFTRKLVVQVALGVTTTGFLLSLGALAAAKFDLSRIDPLASPQVTPTMGESIPSADVTSNGENDNSIGIVTQTVAESFTNISVDSENCDVHLIPSQEDTCQVEYPTHPEMTCSVSVHDDTLQIVFEDNRIWTNFISASFQPMEINLYLPQTQYEHLELETVSGTMTVPENFSFTQSDVHTTSGEIQFTAHNSESLSLESVSGNISVNDVTPQALKIHTTSGDIHLSQVVTAGPCTIDSVSGDVKLKDCDAPELTIDTTSGDVEASLRSGKTFSTQTVSGDVDVPSDSSGGSCNISTISGDITCTIQ